MQGLSVKSGDVSVFVPFQEQTVKKCVLRALQLGGGPIALRLVVCWSVGRLAEKKRLAVCLYWWQ